MSSGCLEGQGVIKYLGASELCRDPIYAYYITLSARCDRQTCQSTGSPAGKRREESLCSCLPPLARFSGLDYLAGFTNQVSQSGGEAIQIHRVS